MSSDDSKHSIDLKSPELYLNRELSLLEFNRRVLLLALDHTMPLLERIKFIFICSNNLDEFFEVRVAQLKRQLKHNPSNHGPDGLKPQEALSKISEICHHLVEEQYRIFNEDVFPALAGEQIYFSRRQDWTPKQTKWLKEYFTNEILPVVSPLGLDLAHPFPRLVNKSLHLFITLDGKDAFGRDSGYAVVHVPRSLPRIIRLPDGVSGDGDHFVFISAIVHAFADQLFPGMSVNGCYQFRLTRDSDLLVDEEKIDDLASALKEELQARDFGTAVRLEVADNCPEEIIDFLLAKFNLEREDLYSVNGPVNLNRLLVLNSLLERPDLRFHEHTPVYPKALLKSVSIFEVLAKKNILLHQPFESFVPVIEFIRQAAYDPNVLAIKQTFYRQGKNAELQKALIEGALAGKEVTVVVELRARFEEPVNISLAAELQEAGAIVVYGVVGHKTHAKMAMVVRRENGQIARYVHVGTGNYHAENAKLYTDYGLLTSDPDMCEDVHKVFQQLTGMGKEFRLKKLFQAPFTLQKNLLNLIEREIEHAKQGKKAHIIAKMNGLTDPRIIRAFYRASQVGVNIDLIVRGMCCLRPGVPGVSEHISVRSIVGRFLEHERIFYFYNEGSEQLYCSSADLMERNLFRRVETCFPVEDKALLKRVKKDSLELYLEDNCQSWQLQADGQYLKNKPEKHAELINAQEKLLNSDKS